MEPVPATGNCGIHNEDGLGVLDKSVELTVGDSGGEEIVSTKFGEWPHSCYVKSKREFLGGASLITPGVLVTAKHILR